MNYVKKILRKFIKVAVWFICFMFTLVFVLNVCDEGFLLFGLFGAFLLPFIPVAIVDSVMGAPFDEKLKTVEKEFYLKYKVTDTLKELRELEAFAVTEFERQKVKAMLYEVLYEAERYEECLEIAQTWSVSSDNYKTIAEHLADLHLKIDRQNGRNERWRTYEVENLRRVQRKMKPIRIVVFFLVYSVVGYVIVLGVKKGTSDAIGTLVLYLLLLIVLISSLIKTSIIYKHDQTHLADKMIVVNQTGIDFWYVHRMLHISWNQLKSVEEVKIKSGKRIHSVYLLTMKNENKLLDMMDLEEQKKYQKSEKLYGINGIYIEHVSNSAALKMNIHRMRVYFAGKERNKYEEYGDLLRQL